MVGLAPGSIAGDRQPVQLPAFGTAAAQLVAVDAGPVT